MHYARPAHPPPDPPIPEASALGQDPRHSLFMPHCLAQAELEHTKQRHSFPDRLVRSRSSDIVCPGRRPTSDPGLNRRVAAEERDPAGAFALGPSSSPSKDSLKGEASLWFPSAETQTHGWDEGPERKLRGFEWSSHFTGRGPEGQRRREVRSQPTVVEETLRVGHPQR